MSARTLAAPFAPTERDLTAQVLSAADRFWPKVDRAGDCWLWTAAVDRAGYGKFGIAAAPAWKWIRASRAAWMLAAGTSIPPEATIIHTCDNPRCVRNDEPGTYVIDDMSFPRYGHLVLATQLHNIADMNAKGRGVVTLVPKSAIQGDKHWTRQHPEDRLRGERHPAARLTETQVATLRARYAAGGISFRLLGAQFGICPQHAHGIVHGRKW